MQAEQDGAVRIENLAEVRVARWHHWLAEQRLVHRTLLATFLTPMIGQMRFMLVT